MTFIQYLSMLIKQWKLIVLCLVVTGLGSFIGSKLMAPVYQSTVLVEVALHSANTQSADYTSLLASDQLVQTESQLATSDQVLQEVASHYPRLTVDELAKHVTSAPKLDTQLFEIDVQDPDAAQAAALANDIAATLIRQQLQVTQEDNGRAQQQMQQDLNTTRSQINALTASMAALQGQTGKLAQVAVLQAQLSGLQQHYNQWQTALAQLELSQAQNEDFLRVAQPAQPARIPVRPNIMLYTAAGLVGGLLLGVFLVVVYAELDTRVRSSEELGGLLGWPVLATVWREPASKRDDYFNPAGHNINSEAYRILRTNIGFSSVDKPLHLLMVTSALPEEGKSTVAANLAIFMAKGGKRTLLIDADLRKPSQHTLFGLSGAEMGLTNAVLECSMQRIPTTPIPLQLQRTEQIQGPNVSDAMHLERFIHSVDVPLLQVMPSGPMPPNPSELLDSKAMERFLKEVANAGFDTVILDTPPLVGLSDANILAAKADGVLVVVDMSRAKKGNIMQMKATLTRTGAHVVGCIMNKQRRSRKDSAYSYYYYYRTIAVDGIEQPNRKNAGFFAPRDESASLNGSIQAKTREHEIN